MKNSTIRLSDDYVIVIDEYNYTLAKEMVIKSGKNEGNVNYSPIGYFPDVESAIRRFLKENVNEQLEGIENMSIDRYFERHKEIIEKAVEDILKAVDGRG